MASKLRTAASNALVQVVGCYSRALDEAEQELEGQRQMIRDLTAMTQRQAKELARAGRLERLLGELMAARDGAGVDLTKFAEVARRVEQSIGRRDEAGEPGGAAGAAAAGDSD
jgi:hypothetical protein